MVKRMLIDATHAEETRVVVVNGTRLEEFDVETSTKKQLKGNIYLAKIVRVEPSLQAAFVEYGGNRHGFLAFSEIHPDYYQIPVADRQALLAEQREVMKQSSTAASADFGDGDEEQSKSSFHDASADSADGEEAAEAQNGNGETDSVGGEEVEEEERRRPRSLRNYKIQEVIKRRQIVLVQVVKEERGNKGAALTTYLSLAGRYCVLMPNTARGGGVSRKITNVQDRKRLKAITNDMDIPDGMAVIVRTAGSERTKPEIKRDYEYLLRLWDSVRDLTLKSTAPALVYEEANLIKRSIRDLYSRDIDEIQVDGEEGYRLAKDFMRMLTPSHARRVQLFKDPVMPLFQRYQIEAQLDSMHSPVVQLKSGGYLVINQTEALVAIDVNSGRSTKERHIEETALKTNCEAADEVARQLRLRDLAGLIVIDFIDMEESRNNHTVERRVKEAMRFDRARIQLGKISAFGLLELSRQRLRPSLMETSFLPCPHCGGTGSVRSVESASMHILRAIEEEGIRRRSSEVTVTVHSSIALYILNQKRHDLADIEARYGFQVFLTGDDSLVPPAHRMDKVRSETPIELPRPITTDQPIIEEPDPEPEVEEVDEEVETVEEVKTQPAEVATSDAAAAAGEDGEGRRRRRRRRRRGRRDEGAPVNGEAPVAENDAGVGEVVDVAAAPETAADENAEDDEEDAEAAEAIAVADGDPAPRRRRRGKRGGRRRHRRADGQEVDADGNVVPEDASADENAEASSVEAKPSQTETVAAELTSEAPEAAAPETPAKPKRTRRKAKAADAETPAEAAPAEAAVATEPAPAKPKRTRAPRKKAAAPAETPVETPAVTAEIPAASEDVLAPSSVPQIVEPVQVTPEPAPEPEAPKAEPKPAEPAAPPRKGWWNRFL
ncbi:Rne/Rng family ribonuclease [Telmatospirillum siberiense]|uniref:Ribonuclease E n=1 Tax=Telmatospirillum siberiense TaxID=382514 RepID=A0A2N3PXG4_9PROT|nr:ribonuclease E/G [Telmatospirillum siberiense]PKU25078.1 ribonuclease E/G [Telmatospirillum siberiense]